MTRIATQVIKIKYTLHVVPAHMREQITLGTPNLICGSTQGEDYVYVTKERLP